MRGDFREEVETERGKPRRGKGHERIGLLIPGNTGQVGTDSASAAILEVRGNASEDGNLKRQEGQKVSKGTRGYRGGKYSEGRSLDGTGMK